MRFKRSVDIYDTERESDKHALCTEEPTSNQASSLFKVKNDKTYTATFLKDKTFSEAKRIHGSVSTHRR